ncbi:MAG: amidohydrolase family protein, partial [Burkholderiales bacterium]
IYTYPGRCPVPELIDAGVNVALGADSPSTHNCDIFLDMKAAIDQQRIHFKDAGVLPPGKVLEMATIDGCKALGLDGELGSIETGKQADLITIDLFHPHLYPLDMLVYRLVYNATGADVTDVVVSGRLIMEARKILTIDEAQVLERVQSTYERFVIRAELEPLRKNAARMWGASRE